MSLINKKILITCGPTWVPIDDMRVISNCSTGEMGQILAQAFKKQKASVTLLEGPVLEPLKAGNINVKKFIFFEDLRALLKTELKKKYDVIIHAAAVSDYRLENPHRTKLRSGQRRLRLDLIPTQKIIDGIKGSAPSSLLVGFKLESTSDKKTLIDSAKHLSRRAFCDLVVANSRSKGYHAYIINCQGQQLAQARSKAALSKALLNTIKKLI